MVFIDRESFPTHSSGFRKPPFLNGLDKTEYLHHFQCLKSNSKHSLERSESEFISSLADTVIWSLLSIVLSALAADLANRRPSLLMQD